LAVGAFMSSDLCTSYVDSIKFSSTFFVDTVVAKGITATYESGRSGSKCIEAEGKLELEYYSKHKVPKV
jgi:hypothetical protein